MKVVWTRQPFVRLAEIEDFIALDSRVAAGAHTAKLIRQAEALAQSPELGRLVPELAGSDLRELIEGNYRIVFGFGVGGSRCSRYSRATTSCRSTSCQRTSNRIAEESASPLDVFA